MSDPFAWREFGNFLLEAPVGLSLIDELRARYPAISREDVYLGIAFAWSEMRASLLIAQLESQEVERGMKPEAPA